MNTPAIALIDRSTLLAHADSILDFYRPRMVDKDGGFFQTFRDDGTRPGGPDIRHLVSSCRMVVNFSEAYLLFGRESDRDIARHGMQFIHRQHARSDDVRWWWTLEKQDGNWKPADHGERAYGLAFVLLMFSRAQQVGLATAGDIALAWEHMRLRFELPDGEPLLADERDANGTLLSYRGQNANMHACEALIAAGEATGDVSYLHRALAIAKRLCVNLCEETDGWVWEHYHEDWTVDLDYHRDNPRDLYRPWGYQIGHQTEWAKLLLQLAVHFPDEDWLKTRAAELLKAAFKAGWDMDHDGLVYGVDLTLRVCDPQKHFWVQAESLAAAWRVSRQTPAVSVGSDAVSLLWEYAQHTFIDKEHGAWKRVLEQDGSDTDGLKAAPGAKCDYHTFCAIVDMLRAP